MAESLGHKAITGTIWASIDRMSTMAIQFIINLILARLLMPEDFGYIGMLAIFISVSQTLIDGGFGSALIQKKEPSQTDYSTVFYWNLLFAIFLYSLLFLCAPFVASFFRLPLLCRILRILGVILIINAFVIVQNNRLRKQLAFRTIALVNISSYITAAIIAVWLAYKGMGVWSLVAMQLLCGIFQNCLLWSIVRWHPSLQFSVSSLESLFGFGGYLLAANILQVICQNLQGFIIGRRFSASQMGFYSQAKKLDDVSSYALPNIIVQIIFPVFSQFQNDKRKLQELLGMSVRMISFIIFPLMLLLILVAKPLIVSLYGEKWLPSVPYFQVLCIGGIFVCLQNINYYAVAAIGRSKTLFNWSFYKWGVLLMLLLIGSHWGMYGILWGMVLSSMNIYAVNAFLVRQFVGYAIKRQIRDLFPILAISVINFCGIYLLQQSVAQLNFIFTISAFFIIYVLEVFILRLRVMTDISLYIREIIIRKSERTTKII